MARDRVRKPLGAIGLAAWLALVPRTAEAHVKWFVQPDDPNRPRVDWGLVLSGRTALLLAVAAAALGLLYFLQRLLGDPHWPNLPVFERMAIGAPTLLAVQAAITLVYAAVRPALFVPNIPLPHNAFGFGLAGVELLVAFSFITGIGDWLGALALVPLWVASLYRLRYFDTLDMLFWLGIAVVTLVIGRTAVSAGHPRPWLRCASSPVSPSWPRR